MAKAAAACGVFRLRNSSVITDDKMAENEPHIVFRDKLVDVFIIHNDSAMLSFHRIITIHCTAEKKI